ncbi:MAG: hypothetical protein IPK64_12260 [bacterium]|nr:hypothetical protein [bacterium]
MPTIPAAPHPRRSLRRPSTALGLGLALLGLAAALPAGPACAQAVAGNPVDVQFTVVDATTGQPATAERLVIDYIAGRLNTVFDTRPSAPSFTAAGVPVKDIGQYVLTLWYQGVPYWWQKRGSDLLAGPVQLDVFSATEAREGVTMTGLNIVVRQRGDVAEFEFMAEVTNDAQPQTTVLRNAGTFELPLPAGATAVEATYRRGPEPTPIAVTVSGTRAALAMPLTPGSNHVRLVARASWDGALDLPVGSDLPLASWSLLVTPPSVTVESPGLQAPDETSAPGYVRRPGPPLGAGESLVVRLHAGTPAGTPEQLFTAAPESAAGDAVPAAAADKDKRGLPLPLAALLVLVIIGALVLVRRARS